MVVEHVRFDGATRSSPAELRHLARVRNGVSLWSIDLDAVAAQVRKHPWVARAIVERSWPNTIQVTVVEHDPVALLAWEGGLYYVDLQGRPFLKAGNADLDYPLITGLDTADCARDPDIPRLALRDAMWLLRSLDARDLIAMSRVSEVSFSTVRGFTVQTTGAVAGHPTAQVVFGLGDYERQLHRLGALLARDLDLTLARRVDLAPQRVAIDRPLRGHVARHKPARAEPKIPLPPQDAALRAGLNTPLQGNLASP